MAHRSWCAEHGDALSNERLEFLGDAVLGWVVADVAFRAFPDYSEGQLSDLRKSVVNAAALADVARSIGLGRCVMLGRGEALAGGADKTSILSDAMEALIGAVYLDGGMVAAHDLVTRLIGDRLDANASALHRQDYKTQLQELAAQRDHVPVYAVSGTGPDHAKSFKAVVTIDGVEQWRGSGRTKKLAEQAAAEAAVHALRSDA